MGANYNGIEPTWDDNLVISFHKYWNYNDEASIRTFLEIRNKYNVPLYLGESGENSNVWFTEAIRLMESNNIGWAWWPHKKMGFNNPLEIKTPVFYKKLLNYWYRKGPKPSREEAKKALMEIAVNTNIEHCIFHKDVVDALFRQVYSTEAIPFKARLIKKSAVIEAVDYDLGRSGVAYHDLDSVDYHNSTGKEWGVWNAGSTYRNDGVDIQCNNTIVPGCYVSKVMKGEWLQYSLNIAEGGSYLIKLKVRPGQTNSTVSMMINNKDQKSISIKGDKQKSWIAVSVKNVRLNEGMNIVKIHFLDGDIDFKSIELIKN